MDNQTLMQPQMVQNNDSFPDENNNPSAENHEKNIKKYERLEHAKSLIVIAFVIFMIVFAVIGFSIITDLNCQCDYAVCFCGSTMTTFGLIAAIPVIISTILAAKGMLSLRSLENEGVSIFQWCKVLGTISLLQIPIFLVMLGIAFSIMG